jgi:hypothetical protein
MLSRSSKRAEFIIWPINLLSVTYGVNDTLERSLVQPAKYDSRAPALAVTQSRQGGQIELAFQI